MSGGRVVALGSAPAVDGFALGGAEPVHAEDDDEVRRCWDALPAEVALVILTPAADAALRGRAAPHPHLLTARIPT